jgi:hypothetical protein
MLIGKFFRWLRPGLRIKRWIALIFTGIFFAVAASLAIYFWFKETGSSRFSNEFGISIPLIDSQSELGVLLLIGACVCFALSGVCLITGIYRLMKSMWDLVGSKVGNKGLIDAAYERAVLSRGPKVVCVGGGTGLSCVLTSPRSWRWLTTVEVPENCGRNWASIRPATSANA